MGNSLDKFHSKCELVKGRVYRFTERSIQTVQLIDIKECRKISESQETLGKRLTTLHETHNANPREKRKGRREGGKEGSRKF